MEIEKYKGRIINDIKHGKINNKDVSLFMIKNLDSDSLVDCICCFSFDSFSKEIIPYCKEGSIVQVKGHFKPKSFRNADNKIFNTMIGCIGGLRVPCIL